MVNHLWRAALWLTALLVLPVALIRAQPYDDRELRALLVPPDKCPTPCFMGIQPGVTSAEDALAILAHHPWVAEIEGMQPETFRSASTKPNIMTPIIRWKWHDRRPDWIAPDQSGELWLVNGEVRYVGVYTSFLLGDMLLTLGNPDSSNIASYANAFGRFWSYDGWYNRQRVWAATGGFCPIRHLYTGQLLIRFQVAPPDYYGPGAQRSIC